MKQLQENDILQVSSLLAVSRGIACTLLLRKNWSVSSVSDEWFADEERVRVAVGISTKPKPKQITNKEKNYCKICMETVNLSRMLSTSCGHLFCSDCWINYIAVSINDGAQCLTLRCPEPKCAAAAGLDMVEALAAADDKRRFHRYLYRSYVESSRERKWCPAPGCDYAVEFDGGGEEELATYDVVCDCGYKFCWRCTEEQHRPVGCDKVAKWAEKNSSEAENNAWILAYTKPCPRCNKQIEKNQGCNHMTCKCGYEFCWLCLEKWKNYQHACNEFKKEKEAARGVSMEATRVELMRYAHYHERWASNHKSREIALADVIRARNEHLPELSRAQETPETDLKFLVEAWDQIVECRRVLKWSYTYGYYIEAEKVKKIAFFDYLQGEAEAALERLHHCAEKETVKFIKPGRPSSQKFGDFRMKLSDLTVVTRKYFENLVRALECDLSEVDQGVGSN
ncbi:RING/U-box superfamily protein [Perilla frutescens var. frutescens]|nr:RING/U-box superfamily protein [Perilla frutescens var. frutescens]